MREKERTYVKKGNQKAAQEVTWGYTYQPLKEVNQRSGLGELQTGGGFLEKRTKEWYKGDKGKYQQQGWSGFVFFWTKSKGEGVKKRQGGDLIRVFTPTN